MSGQEPEQKPTQESAQAPRQKSGKASKPNVLLITADQWRGDCLSVLSHPVVETPNLDALAAEGVLFRRHYTNAVPCGPSRASLHTGLYLHNHRSGTNGTPLDSRFTNWALELREAGYDPALFGYTHTAPDPRQIVTNSAALLTDEGILPGIRPVVDMATHCPDWRAFLKENGYTLPKQDGATYGHRNPDYHVTNHPAPTLYDREHSDTWYLMDQAMNWMQASEQPWCVHLSLRAPHPPWVATAPYHLKYDPDQLPPVVRQPDASEEGSLHPWLREHLQTGRNQSHENDRRHRFLQAGYYGLMSEVDDNMGRLVGWLKQNSQWDNTLLIFTSDHGEQMGDHWMYGKAGFFEQSYHIPLIITGPGIGNGECNQFTEHVDIMPTMLELAGEAIPRQCDGASLSPFLRGEAVTDWRRAAHYEFDFRHSQQENTLGCGMESACLNVVRDEHYKYVHFADLPCLLFDLTEDPSELVNVASERPEIVARYAGELLGWRMKTTDKTLSHLQVRKVDGLVNLLT